MKGKTVKVIILTLGFFLLIGTSFSQNPLQKGDFQLNGGFGFSNWGIPIYIGFDHGITGSISVGGELSYRSYHENWSGLGYDHSVVGVSGNGNYHLGELFSVPPQWDLYAGFNIGFYIWNSPSGYGGNHSSELGLGAQVGARYYLLNTFGINLEFGGGNAFSGGKLGVSIKF